MYSNSGDAIAPAESLEPDHHNHESVDITSIYPPPASAAAATPIYGREYIAEALVAASQMPRRNPGSSFPIFDNPSTSAEDPASTMYARSNIIAKQNRATMPKKVQVRRPWTNEEENALIDYITTHCADGISWSALKARDISQGDAARLSARSAEDMRFKARNMRVTMMM